MNPEYNRQELPLPPTDLFKLRKGSEGWSIKIPYVIQDILPAKSLCCVYGPPGSYKSFLAFSWACHITTGLEWDSKETKEGAVLYVAAEGGSGIALRIKAWEQYYSNTATNLYRIDEPVQLSNHYHMENLKRHCDKITRENDLKLIIIDTVSRCFNGKDENSTKDMGEFISYCDILRNRYNATVLLIHHSGKDSGRGTRGSSALPGASDVEIRVSKSSTNPPQLSIEFTKFKDAEAPQTSAYTLIPVEIFNNTKVIGTSLTVLDEGKNSHPISNQLGPNQQKVLEATEELTCNNEPCTYKVLRPLVVKKGVPSKTAKRTIDTLVEQGHMLVDETGLYCLPTTDSAE